jgi:hypothetical protein
MDPADQQGMVSEANQKQIHAAGSFILGTFRAFVCGIRAGRTPGTAGRLTFDASMFVKGL